MEQLILTPKITTLESTECFKSAVNDHLLRNQLFYMLVFSTAHTPVFIYFFIALVNCPYKDFQVNNVDEPLSLSKLTIPKMGNFSVRQCASTRM